jgi:hypothetical protein
MAAAAPPNGSGFISAPIGAMMGMPALIRRRSSDHPFQQCWLICYGDIHAGTIFERTGYSSS